MSQVRWAVVSLCLATIVAGVCVVVPAGISGKQGVVWVSPAQAQSLSLLGAYRRYLVLNKAGKYIAALKPARQALELAEKEFGAHHETTGIMLYNLAELYRRLGNFRQAKRLFARALAIQERLHGRTHPSLGVILVRLGFASRFSADYKSAEYYYRRYQALVEAQFPVDKMKLVAAYSNLAGLYREQGRYGEAEPLYKKSIEHLVARGAKARSELAIVRDNLAVLYREQGRYSEAERLQKQALADILATKGATSINTGHVYNNLAALYQQQGRYRQAEPMMERAVEIFEKRYPPTNPRLGFAYDNLAGIKRHLRKFAEAERYYKKALTIIRGRLHANHPDLALALNNLSMLYVDMGAFAKAKPLQLRALEISRRAFGPRHASVAFQLANLADLSMDLKDLRAAEQYLLRSVEISREVLGPDHPELAKRRFRLAALRLDQGRAEEALRDFQEAARVFLARSMAGEGGGEANAGAELKRNRRVFEGVAWAAWQVAALEPARRGELRDAAFQAAQSAQQTDASAALGQMAARFAAGDGALAALVREHQDLAGKQARTDAALIKAVSLPPNKRDMAREGRLRNRLQRIARRLARIEARLAADFPDYAELSNPKPLALAQMRELLHPGEAVVQFLFTRRGSLAWLVTPQGTRWVRLDLDRRMLARHVSALRLGLSEQGGAPRTNWGGLPFDLARSHTLYQLLFGKLEAELADVRHLIVIPSAALTALPPAVLITEKPERARGNFATYRNAPWLIRKFAITVLPSASSLRALRTHAARAARAGRKRQPFMGIGDPLLAGPQEEAARGGAVRSAGRRPVLSKLFRGAQADVRAVRELAPLPDSADELKAIARSLQVGEEGLLLRERARERVLKKVDLARYRVLAFATHGLIAGELEGLAEPALVLTPPDKATPLDDGLLTASEVARLRLDADWVLLSACNTASGDGRPGAEGLSGLARAFFYAGARSLLVSHWPVISSAAVHLTTGAFDAMKMARDKEEDMTRAEALRQSMLALIANPADPMNAHPEFWAPFVLVGEGGQGHVGGQRRAAR